MASDDDDDEGFVITRCHEVKTIFTEWQAGYERKMQRRAAEERNRQRQLQLQQQEEDEEGTRFLANESSSPILDFLIASPPPTMATMATMTLPAPCQVEAPLRIPATTTATSFSSSSNSNSCRRHRSISPPRSRTGSRDRAGSGNTSLSSSSTHRSSSPHASPPRHLSRINALFTDQSMISTRLYAMFAEDSGPVVTLVDRNLHRNYVDSIVPHKALEWKPSGKITSNEEHLQPLIAALDLETQRSERERRKRKRQVLIDAASSVSKVKYRQRDHRDAETDIAYDMVLSTPTTSTTSSDVEITTCLRQGGRNYPLEIFRTSEQDKGWGLASTTAIPSGSLVLIFTGEIISEKEAARRECARKGRYILRVKGFQLAYDAWRYGGPARFINSDDEPNLRLQVFLFDGRDASITPLSNDDSVPLAQQAHLLPIVAFFARKNVSPFQELTYDYEKPYI